jgi:RNA polymerase sigma factor (TIGR02999 family)
VDSTSPKEVTRLLNAWSGGNQAALDQLMPLVYDELRRIARGYMRGERPDNTLQPTALVNEAYLRLIGQREVRWQNRAHFFAIAAKLMRRILVDRARRHRAAKRGGPAPPSPLVDVAIAPQQNVDLLLLDDALNRLSDLDAEQARIVELKYFAGLTIEEIAEVLGSSPATVKREWSVAKAWLHRQMTIGSDE